jgi:hypothetical protein
MSSIDFADLYAQQQQLGEHRVFSLIQTRADLATFMSWHVFAVWDFMSLSKRLQAELTGISTPWLPPQDARAARLINEIILAEESDELPDGGYASHHDMYLSAMREVGADTGCIRAFIDSLRAGEVLSEALAQPCIAAPVRQFVTHTLHTVQTGSLAAVLGSFFFGRESVIPAMFKGLLTQWGLQPQAAPMFVYYLRRHIELDADSHGPAAMQLIETVLNGNAGAVETLLDSARQAIDARAQLWDALAMELENRRGLEFARAG